MAGNNKAVQQKIDKTKDHSNSGIRSLSLMGSNEDGEAGTGNSLKGVSIKRKRGRTATKHKKANHSHKNKYSSNKRHYRNTSSSLSSKE